MISLSIALKYNRKLTEAVPAGVYLFMLLSYILGITGHVSHVAELLLLFEIIGLIITVYLWKVNKTDITMPFRDAGNVIFLIILILLWFLSLHMRVTNFDDFHSWAITPKDMYYVNGLPTGNMASTFYRDYFPTVFIMDFLMFKLSGGFSEGAMFFVLWALMLVSLSVLFHKREDDDVVRFICRVSAGVMLPFLFSFQFLHCLGTDILATTVFGSALVYIMENDRKKPGDCFDMMRVVLTVTILGMLKTTSLILAMVCIGVYLVRNIELKKLFSWINFFLLSFATGGFWLSWKVFCRIKGNTTYLSDNLERNIQSGYLRFPEYAVSTAGHFFIKLFTYGLNDGRAGLSGIMILMLFIISFIIYMKHSGKNKEDRLSLIVIILGLVGYLLVMLYIYLFVFEEWEALSLSSYDRYIATYFGAMLYLALYLMLKTEVRPKWVMPVVMILLTATLNFDYVGKTLIPAGYEKEYGELISEIDAIEEEFVAVSGERPVYGESIVIIDPSTDQLRAKVLPYAAVPGVTRLIRPSDEGVMPSEQEIVETAEYYGARIIDLRR